MEDKITPELVCEFIRDTAKLGINRAYLTRKEYSLLKTIVWYKDYCTTLDKRRGLNDGYITTYMGRGKQMDVFLLDEEE